VPIRLLPYDHPARYNDSLGKDAWDIGLAARDPSRGEHLAFNEVFMEVDNGYVARPGLSLKSADEVDRAGIRIAVAQGSAPEGFLTRNIKNAEIVRVPGGLGPARGALCDGQADIYGENIHRAHRIAADYREHQFSQDVSMSYKCRSRCRSRIPPLSQSSMNSCAIVSVTV
jgi:polar amino acid transport system substrate-binding protein